MTIIRNPLHLEIIPAPGTLSKWEEIEARIEMALPFAESIHIDVVDGKFAPNTTWMDPAPFAKYTKHARFEVHFMTEDPLQYVKAYADCGFQRFIGQVEKMPDVAAFLGQAQLWGEAGLAYDGPTNFDKLSVAFDDVDVVHFYTGERAGESNGVFVPEKLQKVERLRKEDPFVPIEIDGGVNDKNVLLAKQAGVTRFVSTGFLFNGKSFEEQFLTLQKLLHES